MPPSGSGRAAAGFRQWCVSIEVCGREFKVKPAGQVLVYSAAMLRCSDRGMERQVGALDEALQEGEDRGMGRVVGLGVRVTGMAWELGLLVMTKCTESGTGLPVLTSMPSLTLETQAPSFRGWTGSCPG